MDLWVIYPSGRLSTAKARAFVQWFEQIISRDITSSADKFSR